MQHQYSAGILIDSGDARGFDKRFVTDRFDRFKKTMQARFAGTVPLKDPQGSYVQAVVDMLDEIQQVPVGVALVNKLDNSGYRVVVTMPEISFARTCKQRGLSPNTARTGGGDNFRRPIGNPLGQPVFAQARTAANNAGFDDNALAGAINHATLMAGNPLVVSAQQLHDWCTGAATLPTDDQLVYRYLVFTLENWLPKGSGVSSRVAFDPWNPLKGTERRPPVVGLFHELCHAVLNATGKQVFNDDQTENERMVIGLAPFNQVQHVGRIRQYTENQYRAAIGLAARPSL